MSEKADTAPIAARSAVPREDVLLCIEECCGGRYATAQERCGCGGVLVARSDLSELARRSRAFILAERAFADFVATTGKERPRDELRRLCDAMGAASAAMMATVEKIR